MTSTHAFPAPALDCAADVRVFAWRLYWAWYSSAHPEEATALAWSEAPGEQPGEQVQPLQPDRL